MTRVAARLRHDEIARMVKAVQSCGLSVARVTFDGNRVDVIIGESGEKVSASVDDHAGADSVAEVETL